VKTKANIPLAEAKARQVVADLDLQRPEDIDLDLVAAHFNVFVQEDFLTSCEARMVRRGNSAVVTVNRQIAEVGRKRFSVAHELGHFLLHAGTRQLAFCEAEDMRSWSERFRPEETEANSFAAELLMPGAMVTSRVSGHEPSFDLVSRLAHEFRTSTLYILNLRYYFIVPHYG
jgi:Zn-dependent peptidase ImmA (M78 family)